MSKRMVSYKHTFINALGTLVSRVSGIIKWTVVNHMFGAKMDPFMSSFKLINNLRRIVAEGTVSNAFIPVFQSENQADREKANLFANNIINIFIIVTIIITILGIFLAPYYFPLLVPGYETGSDKMTVGITLTMIMMPFTIFISMFAIGMGILNSNKRFTTPAFAPLLFNISFILFPIFTHKYFGIYSVGIGVAVGGALMFLFEIIELVKIGFKYKFYMNLKDPHLKKFVKLFLPTSLNMGVLMATALSLTVFISFLADGSFTIQQNAFIINQAPLGVFGVAIGTVMLPLLSGINIKESPDKFRKAIEEGFFLLFYLIIPISLFLIFYPDIVSNLLHRDLMLLFTGNTGAFSDTIRTGIYKGVSLYALSLLPMSANVIFAKVFYSVSDAKTPLWGSVIFFVFSLTGYVLFFLLNKNGILTFTFENIIITDVVAAWMLALFYLFKMKNLIGLQNFSKKLMIKTLKIIMISFLMILAVFPFYKYIYSTGHSALISIFYGIISLVGFSGLYYLITRIFNVEIKR